MDSTVPFTGTALAGDWARFRDQITTLYIEEDKPLKEVKRIMEEEYYFVATDKMYKSHFSKWGVQKYFRRRQVGQLLAEKSRRAGLGKSTKALIHGRTVDEDRLNTYLKRLSPAKRKQVEEMMSTSTRHGTQETSFLICRTPSPRLPQRIEGPDSLKAFENGFHSVQLFITSSHESGLWERAAETMPIQLIAQWVALWFQAIQLIMDERTTYGFKLLSHCFYLYKASLRRQCPLLLAYTCWALCQLVDVNEDLPHVFTNYASNLSRCVLGPTHPISSFFSTVQRIELTELIPYLARLTEHYIEKGRIADHYQASSIAELYSDLARCGLIDHELALARIYRLIGELVTDQEHANRRTIQTMQFEVANVYLRYRRHSEAKQIAEQIVKDVTANGTAYAWVKLQCYGILSYIEAKSGNIDAAVDYAYKALHVAHDYYGAKKSHQTFTISRTLQHFLLRAGREEEAHRLQFELDRQCRTLCGRLEALELNESGK